MFSDDLSMAGAREAGNAEQRSLVALDAGADMILICNDRSAVLQVAGTLEVEISIASRARLAAMRPQPHPDFAAAFASDSWREQRDELLAAVETPPLRLDGAP